MEIVARAGPAYIEGVVTDLELAGLLAQVVHVFYQVAERRVLLATFLGSGVILQQAPPELATQIVDGRQVDDLQAQALFERRFIQGFAADQAAGEHQYFSARGHVEQRRAAEFFRPGAAIQAGHVHRRRVGVQAKQARRQ